MLLLVTSTAASAQDPYRATCRGEVDVLEQLVSAESVEQPDERGRSLLHWAVGCQRPESVDFLLALGADPIREDNESRTPLHAAIRYNQLEVFRSLVEAAVQDTWRAAHGTSLMDLAVLTGSPTFVQTLVVYGIDINAPNERGSTPLEIARRVGNAPISELLVQMGARPALVRDVEVNGRFMGVPLVIDEPMLLAPHFVSTEESEFGSAFNRAGDEFYYGVDVFGKNEIRHTRLVDGAWTRPAPILSHAVYGYNDPILSPDEERLYFISNRALDGRGARKDIDIWYVEVLDEGWSEPINAGPTINTAGDEYYISFTDEYTMYFASDGHGSEGVPDRMHDIYHARMAEGEFQRPVALGPAVNTEAYEADVFVAPDESYVIFTSTREGGQGRGDLYVSFRDAEGDWSEAVNMESPVNSGDYEYCPFVTADGKYLLFTSRQDIYIVGTGMLDPLRPQ